MNPVMSKKEEKEFKKNLKAAEDYLSPYVDMIFILTADEKETVDVRVMEWATLASIAKAKCPELLIEELLPQNLMETIKRNHLRAEDFENHFDGGIEIELISSK